MKAIFFDIGGVVVTDHGLREEAGKHFEEVEASHLWDVMNEELLLACQGKQSLADGWRAVASRVGAQVPDEILESLWIDDFREGVTINQEVLSVIESLKPQCHLSVVSNTIAEHAEILASMGVYSHFNDVVLSHETGSTKDKPHIFEYALSLGSFDPSDVLFIDDVEKYTNVAKALGMKTHVYTTPSTLRDEIRACGFDL